MRKLLLASVALVAFAVPASAQQSFAIGGGLNFGNANTQTGAATAGLAAAGSLAAAQNTSIGTGIAVASPLGTTAAGIGASVGAVRLRLRCGLHRQRSSAHRRQRHQLRRWRGARLRQPTPLIAYAIRWNCGLAYSCVA